MIVTWSAILCCVSSSLYHRYYETDVSCYGMSYEKVSMAHFFYQSYTTSPLPIFVRFTFFFYNIGRRKKRGLESDFGSVNPFRCVSFVVEYDRVVRGIHRGSRVGNIFVC